MSAPPYLVNFCSMLTYPKDEVGIYGDISVLDEREISGKDGPVTQIWINGWVDESIFRRVMDIIRGG